MNEQIIEFKTSNLKKEFDNPQLDSRLKFICYALAGYCWYNFGKPLFITEIYRTQGEQDQTYWDDPKYQETKWFSVHQFWRGIDFRVEYFLQTELDLISEFLNSIVVYDNSGKQTCLIHNVGQGNHGHIQVNTDNITEIKKIIYA